MTNYKDCKYPNLLELDWYFQLHYFADVTRELMEAVFRGEEDLTQQEFSRIAIYAGLPLKVLTCHKKIVLSRDRWKHRQMMNELNDMLYEIWELQKRGSEHADWYMRKYSSSGRDDFVNMKLAFYDGREVTYSHYLGVKHRMEVTICFAKGEFRKKPRGLGER